MLTDDIKKYSIRSVTQWEKEIAVYMNICMFGQPKEVIELKKKEREKERDT